MRHSSIAVAGAAALMLAGCVQTRQYADTQFAPPSGDYKLLVMRPDVSVGSVTTGGLTEPRADWTEAGARQSARRAARPAGRARRQRPRPRPPRLAARGQRRDHRRARAAPRRGRQFDRASQISRRRPCRPSAARGSTGRSAQQAVALGQRTGMDYALFLHAEDSFASTGRVALQVLGVAGCFVGFCAPNIGGGGAVRLCQPGRSAHRRSGLVQRPQPEPVAGIKSATSAPPEGAAQMVERLLGRMKPGRDVRRALRAGA